jgi:hypothetical protein
MSGERTRLDALERILQGFHDHDHDHDHDLDRIMSLFNRRVVKVDQAGRVA